MQAPSAAPLLQNEQQTQAILMEYQSAKEKKADAI